MAQNTVRYAGIPKFFIKDEIYEQLIELLFKASKIRISESQKPLP